MKTIQPFIILEERPDEFAGDKRLVPVFGNVPSMCAAFDPNDTEYCLVFEINTLKNSAPTIREVKEDELKKIYKSLTQRNQRITLWSWLK